MKHIFIFLIATLAILSCSDSDNPIKSGEDNIIEEAQDFSLKVLDCYFTQDTLTFSNYLNDDIYIIDPNQPPYKKDEFIVSHYLSAYDYSNYSLADYKETYFYEIVSYDQYYEKYGSWFDMLKYWSPKEDDYLFEGYQIKEGKQPFMNVRVLFFFVTKSSGEWKIRALY
jgi:hypothetical protein